MLANFVSFAYQTKRISENTVNRFNLCLLYILLQRSQIFQSIVISLMEERKEINSEISDE